VTAPAPLLCPKCRAPLPEPPPPLGAPHPCLKCHDPVESLIFSSYYRPAATGQNAETIVTAEDAGCFYHPQSRAVVPCDQCGRFLCALCDIELHGRHYCPGCVEAGRKKKLINHLDGDRVLPGSIALMTALLPLLFWPVTVVTGPLAVFMAIYGWRKPGSITGKRHAAHVAALLLGLLQTGVWIFVIAALFR